MVNRILPDLLHFKKYLCLLGIADSSYSLLLTYVYVMYEHQVITLAPLFIGEAAYTVRILSKQLYKGWECEATL